MMTKKNGTKNKILVVEDDWDICKGLCILLGREGYEVLDAPDGRSALAAMREKPDLIVLDIMLPDMSGIDVCREVRRSTNIPILFLTAKSSVQDKSEGLMAGGDDFLVKPFFTEELLARVNALLRRYQEYQGEDSRGTEAERFLEAGGIRLNEQFNEVFKDGKELRLPDIEYRILKLMMQHRGKIFSIRNIYESVWGKPYYYDVNNTVMVHIRKLRLEIEEDPRHPALVRTEWGKGYRFAGK